MLKLMRDNLKHLKWVLWGVVAVFVLLIFVDWGGAGRGSRGGGGSLAGVALRIGQTTVTENQFIKEVRSTEERYRQMYGERYDAIRNQIDLGTIAAQNIVDRTLLLAEAKRMGIDCTDKELLDRIMSFPGLKRQDGAFVGEELYARILRSSNTSPDEFEASLRQEIVIEKLQRSLAAAIVVPQADLEREYRTRNESATFDAVFVSSDRALSTVTVTDAEAKAYYDANQSRFTHPDQMQLRYLMVDDARLRRSLSAPEGQVAEYYNTHQPEFTAGEEVRARHILIKPATADDAGTKAAEAKVAEVAKKAAAAGADFAALAKQHSEDPGTKDNGGDVGWFGRGRMVKEFEDGAFALAPGKVSPPVKTQFGYHVIKVDERRAGGLKPLAEVRDQIRAKLTEGLADGEGNRRASALREKIDAAKLKTEDEWRRLGDDVVTSNVTPFFATGDFIPGLGRDPELMAELDKAKEGFVGGPRRTPRGWIVFTVARVRTAGVTPFDEAKAEATQFVRASKAVEQVRVELEGKRSVLQAAAKLADAAAAVGGVPVTVTDHRRGQAMTTIGQSEALDEAVFAAAVNTLTPVVKAGDRGAAIARVTARKTADMQAFAADKASVRESVVNEELQRVITSMLAEAKRSNPVTMNPDVVNRFKPRQG